MCSLIKAQWEGHCPNFIFHTVSHSMYSSQGTFSQLRLFPEMFSNQKNSSRSKTFHSHFLSFISQSSVDSTYVSSIDWAKNNRINDVVSLWVHYGFFSFLFFPSDLSDMRIFSLKYFLRGGLSAYMIADGWAPNPTLFLHVTGDQACLLCTQQTILER